MIFKRIVLLILICTLLLFCSCGQAEPNDEEPAIEQIPQYTLPPIEKEPVPKIGGELVFPMPENPLTLNPLKANNVELRNLLTLIYESPVHIDASGKAVAELAETWQADAASTIWTFKLRRGVQWQMGFGEFTAQDVLFTMDLIMGYSAGESRYAKYNDLILSYEAPDDYTISITLTEPNNAAIYFMTFPVVCKAYAQSGNIDRLLPAGTGPYLVTEYDEREQMLLLASDVWWKDPPFIKRLTAECYSDHDTELVAFDANMLDFVTTSTLAIDTYVKYEQTESIDYLTQYYDCLIPNMVEGILTDINVRQAIAYALDKREIISKELLGHAVAADYPIPLNSFLSGGSTNIYEYNLQKAIELLESAGWKNRDEDDIYENIINTQMYDLKIELLIPESSEDTYRRDVADNITAQLIYCGIEIIVDEVPYNEYVRRLQSKEFELALCSFYLDQNPDSSFMIGTDGTANYGGFSDLNMDFLLQNCRTASNDADLNEAYLALENYFVEQAPQIGLYFRTNSLIYDSAITVVGEVRDLIVYTSIPKWYLFVEDGTE